MIHEYALEPELVATWGNPQDGRYFVEKFGLGQPRVVSRYPKQWKKLVLEACQGGDVEKKRVEVLVQRLGEQMVRRRDYLWDQTHTWAQNARAEHERASFRAILARENPDGHPRVLIGADLNDTIPLWAVPRAVKIVRRAAEMAAAVGAMLRIAKVVLFVDPYFGPDRPSHRRTLEAFLEAIIQGRCADRPGRVEVHTAADDDRNGTRAFFETGCQGKLPRCIPTGLTLRIVRLEERQPGEHLHNRYILTDFGGVLFGAGLDEGGDGATDDVHLLDLAQYNERWQQYASDAPAFDRPEPPIDIQGR
jgi:hypothetical protein